jgi:hypothetical protein
MVQVPFKQKVPLLLTRVLYQIMVKTLWLEEMNLIVSQMDIIVHFGLIMKHLIVRPMAM